MEEYTSINGDTFKHLVHSFAPFEEVLEHCHFWQERNNVLYPLRTIHDCMPKYNNRDTRELEEYIEKLLQQLYQTFVQDYPEQLDSFVEIASDYECIPSLEILYQYAKENDIDFPIASESIRVSTDISFLEWWRDKLPEDYQLVVTRADIFENEGVVKWWTESGFQIVLDKGFVFDLEYGLEPDTIRILHNAFIKIPRELLKKTISLIAAGDTIVSRERRFDDLKEVLDWMFEEYEDIITDILMDECDPDSEDFCIADGSDSTYYLLRYLHAKGIPFHYTEQLVDNLSDIKQVAFWEMSGLPIKHTSQGFINCLEWDVEIGQWWLDNGLKHENNYCIDTLINRCMKESIKFLMNNNIGITYTEQGLDRLKVRGTVDQTAVIGMIQWLIDSGLELKYTEIFINNCLTKFAYKVLDFCYENNKYIQFPIEKDFSELFPQRPYEKNYFMMIKWWLDHDLKLILSDKFLVVIAKMPTVLKLLEEQGYMRSSSGKPSLITDFSTEDLIERLI